MAPPWANPQVADELVKAMAAPTGDSLDKAPLAVREAMLFPYRAGFAFVAALRRHKPWSAVDAVVQAAAALDRADPASREVRARREADRGDRRAAAVAARLRDRAHTVWGELGFELFLRAHGVNDQIAARGRGGVGRRSRGRSTRRPAMRTRCTRSASCGSSGTARPMRSRLTTPRSARSISRRPAATLVQRRARNALARARRHRELRRTPRQRGDARNRHPGATRRVRDLRQLDRTSLAIHFFATLA